MVKHLLLRAERQLDWSKIELSCLLVSHLLCHTRYSRTFFCPEDCHVFGWHAELPMDMYIACTSSEELSLCTAHSVTAALLKCQANLLV